MFKNLSDDIAVIEGIGPKTAELFQQAKVRTIQDFMVKPCAFYHRKVKSIASINEVKQWQKMAFFMQIDEVNGQYAEALVKGGVKSIGLLGLKSLEALKTLFAKAEADNIIPSVPSDEEIVGMIRSATALNYSSSLGGQVVDDECNPVTNATVRIGEERATSNANGFFRMAGLKRDGVMTIETEDGQCFKMESYKTNIYPDESSTQKFTINPADSLPTEMLDEYDGDVLPPARGYRFVVDHEAVDSLRNGDYLIVREFYKDGKHVKLSSVFSAFDGTKFIAKTFKFPLANIDINIEERDYLSHHNGRFRKVKYSHTMKKNWLKVKRFNKENPRPADMNKETLKAYMNERIKYLLNNA